MDWHDYYAAMAQVIPILVLAAVVERDIITSALELFYRRRRILGFASWVFIGLLWLSFASEIFILWNLSEPPSGTWHDEWVAWGAGAVTVVLASFFGLGVSRRIRKESVIQYCEWKASRSWRGRS